MRRKVVQWTFGIGVGVFLLYRAITMVIQAVNLLSLGIALVIFLLVICALSSVKSKTSTREYPY